MKTMMPKPPRSLPRPTILRACLIVGFLTASTLAGCLAIVDPDGSEEDEASLNAELTTARAERWNDEVFTLDGRDSTGGIAHWVFDLDDGTRIKGDNISDAHIQHAYQRGGAYEVRFTVYQQHPDEENDTVDATGSDTQRRSANTTLSLVVNERQRLDEKVLAASPLNGSMDLPDEASPERAQYAFEVHGNASSVEAEVNLENIDRLEEAEVTVRILDVANESVAQANKTLEPQEAWTLRLEGGLSAPGGHLVEITVDAASVRADGELRVYYNVPGSDDGA